MNKRIETATEVVTVGRDNVVRVQRKGATIPRNFSFAALSMRPLSTPEQRPFKLFANDYHIATGTYADLYDMAWSFAFGASGFSFIIC